MDPSLRGNSDYAVQVAAGTVNQTPIPYTTVKTGEVIVGTVAAVFPSVAVKSVIFKAGKANAGTAYVGAGSTVTLSNGTADATTGLQLVAGDATPVINVDNLNRFWGIASADGQVVTYLATL